MKKVYQELPICTSLLLSKLSEVLIFCDCPAPKMNSWGGTTRSGREKMEVALMLLKAGTGTWSSIFGKLKVNDCALREWEYEMEGLGPSIDPNSFLSYSCSCWYTAETHCKNVRKVRDEILPMSKWDFILVKHNRNRRNMDSYRSLNLKGKTVLFVHSHMTCLALFSRKQNESCHRFEPFFPYWFLLENWEYLYNQKGS